MQVLSGKFRGWLIDQDGDLCDPAGNRYRPEDLRAAWWGRQAWQARAGTVGQVRFLKQALEERVRKAQCCYRVTGERDPNR